jgi:signal transduction histidine kinase
MTAIAASVVACLASLYAIMTTFRLQRLKKTIKERMTILHSDDRSRTHFLVAIGHDLRQPLQAAAMFGEVLSKRLEDTPNAAIAARLMQAINSTGTLLSSLVEFSNLELGRVAPSPHPVAVAPFLEALFLQMEPLAQDKSLRYLLQTSDATILTDPMILERMVRNLLVNAIGYTDQGGVLLGCRHRSGQIGIQVTDTGIGIPPDQMQSVFEDFTRLAPKSEDGNLGLGLSIVRRSAQLMGHSIEVRSVLGKGSSFTIWVRTV